MIGHEIAERAKEKGIDCAGQLHAEQMLEQQEDIPTRWRGQHGRLYVAYLCWRNGKWHLYWRWLGHHFNGRYRIVCLSKA